MATGVKTLEGSRAGGFLAELRNPYKPGQGVLTRRIAFWTGFGFLVWGCRDLWVWMQGFEALRKPVAEGWHIPRGPTVGWSLVAALVVGLAGWAWLTWFLKRPWLANMLIETEAEMKKVSWPARDEAWGATKVVTVAVFLFTVVLMVFDFGISKLMKLFFNLEI